ncbi:MAG: RNA-binding protein [Chloroflexota bacterium]
MTKKLYVGNLPFSASEHEVKELFEKHGTVDSIAWINDRDTGRFRGFCFIEMPDADAEAAIEALDGHDINGRNMRVNEAKPRENRGGGGGGYRGGGGGNRGGYGGGGNRRDDYGGGSRDRW